MVPTHMVKICYFANKTKITTLQVALASDLPVHNTRHYDSLRHLA